MFFLVFYSIEFLNKEWGSYSMIEGLEGFYASIIDVEWDALTPHAHNARWTLSNDTSIATIS